VDAVVEEEVAVFGVLKAMAEGLREGGIVVQGDVKSEADQEDPKARGAIADEGLVHEAKDFGS
jgi:hypothetical protein